MEVALLFFFEIMIVVSAILVVNACNPIYCVLFLVSVYANSAGLLLVLRAEFLAFSFLVVYIGAIAVLFLFVVMMLNLQPVAHSSPFPRVVFLLVSVGSLMFLASTLLTLFMRPIRPFIALHAIRVDNPTNLAVIGNYLFGYAGFPFIISGIILFTAMWVQ